MVRQLAPRIASNGENTGPVWEITEKLMFELQYQLVFRARPSAEGGRKAGREGWTDRGRQREERERKRRRRP